MVATITMASADRTPTTVTDSTREKGVPTTIEVVGMTTDLDTRAITIISMKAKRGTSLIIEAAIREETEATMDVEVTTKVADLTMTQNCNLLLQEKLEMVQRVTTRLQERMKMARRRPTLKLNKISKDRRDLPTIQIEVGANIVEAIEEVGAAVDTETTTRGVTHAMEVDRARRLSIGTPAEMNAVTATGPNL